MEELLKLEEELNLRKKSEKTVKNYLFFNKKFLEFAKKSPDSVSADDIKQFLSTLDNKSNATLSLAIASLRFFYEKILGKDLFSGIELPKKEKKPASVLTKDEVKQLIENADTGKSKLIISMIYSSGLRVSEVVNIKMNDINFEEKIGYFPFEKEGKTRIFVLSEKLLSDLKQQKEKYPSYQFLFSKEKPLTLRNIQKIIKHTSNKAGFQKKITPHTLRNTFYSHLIESGIPKTNLNALLGYSAPKEAQIPVEELKKIKSPFDSI